MPSIFSRTRAPPPSLAAPDDFGRVTSRTSVVAANGFLGFTTDRQGDGGDIGGYGYMSYERHVVLSPEQVSALVDVVSAELGTRGGITTPFIFSSSALDLSSSAIKRLVRTFLDAQVSPSPENDTRFQEEARFAGPMTWEFRMVDGREERGLVSWDHYTAFRDGEVAANFPPQHFSTFLPALPPPLRSIVITVLSVLARLTANSTLSGHTPPTLSPLFGGIFFGLGVQGAPFHHTYVYYLRATNAMEHLLLSFIRFQDTASLGVPTRLKEWIKGYPLMLASQSSRPEPRKGARTVRLVNVRRNVRAYSRDLIRSASTWECDILQSPPRYSETYRKRMDMPPSFEPEAIGTGGGERFRSLTDFKWGEFEELGFGGLGGDDKKLQFDLTESARNERKTKRQTLSWNDFSSAGFTRTDIAPLMEFSPTPLSPTSSITDSPLNGKKLKKSAKVPVFNWDMNPVVGTEEVVEEAFVDAFCDIICGWPSTEPEEERECNWAIIEFSPKSLILFEEFVPLEYRQQLGSAGTTTRRRLPSLFSSNASPTNSSKSMRKKNSKKNLAASFNGSASTRTSKNAAAEVEFEGLLRGEGGRKTKVIRLGGAPEIVTSPAQSFPLTKTITPIASPKSQANPMTPSKSGSSDTKRRFRLNTTSITTPRKSIVSGIPSEATSVDFETRIASLDSDAYEEYPVINGGTTDRRDEDSWVDILVGSQERRMAGQEYRANGSSKRNARGFGEDPDLVSLEIEEALKGVPRDMSASPEVMAPRSVVPPPVDDGGYGDEDESVEIETVPRRPQSSHSSHTERSYRHEDVEDEEPVEEDEVKSAPPRRLTYFDLHPDRRPSHPVDENEHHDDDPRARFRADSDSEDEGQVEVRDVTPRSLPPVPALVTPPTNASDGSVKSKTAALIEMYREKEKGSSPVAVSKSPSMTPSPTPSSNAELPSPSPVRGLPASPSPPEGISPPAISDDEGRASPARYVHGAPLHNVIEEEEEE
ncbi:hypothetical protein BDZ89DRAFT_1056868 [Hymenopellis radicata]|nr:hypothetical protein BDZ89DRAFT_1056868 [Hymenopellis radicata]